MKKLVIILFVLISLSSYAIADGCISDIDCKEGICDLATSTCIAFECSDSLPCSDFNKECISNKCVDKPAPEVECDENKPCLDPSKECKENKCVDKIINECDEAKPCEEGKE